MALKKVLPIGFVYEGQPYRHFEVNKVDGFLERIIHNDTLRTEKPQTWMAMVLSGLLSRIGDIAVSYEFVESGGKKIPNIVKHIPLPDAGLILVAGHIDTYGSVLKAQQLRCGNCRHKNIVDIDLNDARVPQVNEEDPIVEELTVHLKDGWRRTVDKTKAGQRELGWEDKVFDIFVFGIPTVGDALRNEKIYLTSRLLDFQVKLVNDRLKKVIASKDNFEMPNDMFEAYKAGNMFFADRGGLFANDRVVIRDAINSLPQIDLRFSVTCENCSQDFEAGVGFTSFFPLVS
jgi:hypothetical protein